MLWLPRTWVALLHVSGYTCNVADDRWMVKASRVRPQGRRVCVQKVRTQLLFSIRVTATVSDLCYVDCWLKGHWRYVRCLKVPSCLQTEIKVANQFCCCCVFYNMLSDYDRSGKWDLDLESKQEDVWDWEILMIRSQYSRLVHDMQHQTPDIPLERRGLRRLVTIPELAPTTQRK